MPDTPEANGEIAFGDLLEILQGMTAKEVAQFFADVGVELRPDAIEFTPICHRCGAIKHEMVLISENVPTEELKASPAPVKNMVLCFSCAEEKGALKAGIPTASTAGVKKWRERTAALQEVFYGMPEGRPWIAACHYSGDSSYKPSGDSPKHDYCLRSEDWDVATKGLPYAPGDEPPKPKRVRVEMEEEETGESGSEPLVRKRVRV